MSYKDGFVKGRKYFSLNLSKKIVRVLQKRARCAIITDREDIKQ